MSDSYPTIRVLRAEGEVMYHDGVSGWMRAESGNVLPANAKVTIKTGSSGHCDMLNVRGDLISLPPNSMLVICTNGEDDIDTLRRISVSCGDRSAARQMLRQELLPLF